MVHLGWFVLCERASFDLDTNAVSLIDCVEQLVAVSFPATIHRLVCAAYLFRDEASSGHAEPVRVVVEPPGRPEVCLLEGEAVFDEGNKRSRVRFVLDLFQFKTHGQYHFRLDFGGPKGWRPAARLPVDLVAAEVETPEVLPTSPPRAEALPRRKGGRRGSRG